MKDRRRRFSPDILIHCYQRTIDGGVIFYCDLDFLVCFIIICLTAKRYHIRLLKVCLMYDHIHLVVTAPDRESLSSFMQAFTTQFSKEAGQIYGHKGNLFESPYGSAVKYGAKKARTVLIYADNNPVERQLCRQAELYRWNFLAYGFSSHPFSEKIRLRFASRNIRRAVSIVKDRRAKNRPISYTMMKRLFTGLDTGERQQLTDYIITTYSAIEYEAGFRFFDSGEKMLQAIHANTGSEYDLNEVFVGRSDVCYPAMDAILERKYPDRDIHFFLSLPEGDRRVLFYYLRSKTSAYPSQIAKFLHLPPSAAERPDYPHPESGMLNRTRISPGLICLQNGLSL